MHLHPRVPAFWSPPQLAVKGSTETELWLLEGQRQPLSQRSDEWLQEFIVQGSEEHLCWCNNWNFKCLKMIYSRQKSTQLAHSLGLSSSSWWICLKSGLTLISPPCLPLSLFLSLTCSLSASLREQIRQRQNMNDLFYVKKETTCRLFSLAS